MRLTDSIRALPLRLWAAARALAGQYDEAPAGWSTSEIQVRKRISKSIGLHLAVAKEIEALAYDIMVNLSKPSRPQAILRAHSILLVRTLQDLRACVLLSLRGYTMQAWTAAASAFEAAHAMGFIGADPSRAERWLNHTDQDRGPFSVKDGVVGSFKYLDLGQTASDRQQLVDNEYGLYEKLCMAKHINPLAERNRYWISRDNSTRLQFTPFLSDGRIKEARLGLALAARSAILALWVLSKTHDAGGTDGRILPLAAKSGDLVAGWNSSTAAV
ncbi:MAG: hypothetical protein WD773_00010 [Gemmatimonadales bacterium]